MNWTDVELLARKIIWDFHHKDSDEWLGLAWETHTKAVNTYNGDLGVKFTTYYAKCLRTALAYDNDYVGHVVRKPVLSNATVDVLSIDMPLEGDFTIGDTLASPDENKSYHDELHNFICGHLTAMYTDASPSMRQTIKAMRQHIKSGEPIPRRYRTLVCNLRATLLEQWEKYNKY